MEENPDDATKSELKRWREAIPANLRDFKETVVKIEALRGCPSRYVFSFDIFLWYCGVPPVTPPITTEDRKKADEVSRGFFDELLEKGHKSLPHEQYCIVCSCYHITSQDCPIKEPYARDPSSGLYKNDGVKLSVAEAMGMFDDC